MAVGVSRRSARLLLLLLLLIICLYIPIYALYAVSVQRTTADDTGEAASNKEVPQLQVRLNQNIEKLISVFIDIKV